ncbi:MAG: glycoside hydrolase family 97 N-terminal domain-containing protein [Alistipes sp.]|nr:glycoside hydrolase family 97 N-terminal domain-containing protein [Alistipes sp.]
MKRKLITMLFLLGMLPAGTAFAAAPATLRSPDGRIRVEVETEGRLRYTVSLDGAVLLSQSEAALELSDGRTIGRNDRARRIRRRENVCERIEAPLYRQAAFDFTYNELEISLASGFGITFRATN